MKLLLLAGTLATFIACAPAQSGERTVVIDIEHSSFSPDRLEFQSGETVRFVLKNGDPIDHEFIIGDEEVQEIHEKGTESHHGSKDGEVSIPSGTEASTSYTFTEPGTLIIGCHLAGHYDFGMRGEITVQE